MLGRAPGSPAPSGPSSPISTPSLSPDSATMPLAPSPPFPTITTPTSPSSRRRPSATLSTDMPSPASTAPSTPTTRRSWKPVMPSILGKMRTSMRLSGAWSPDTHHDPQREAREDDDRLFARLREGYPCEDVKHILALTAKHHRELDTQIDFVASWAAMVAEWVGTMTAHLPALTAAQRPRVVQLRAQAETYLSLAHLLALEHAQTGGRLRVAHALLQHARVWIDLGRDRTHQRFEDFERGSEGRGRWERRGSRHDDVAGNLDAIATCFSELSSAESRLPHLHNRLAEAAERLLEAQEDLDDMVASIEVAKGLIEGLVDGSAWTGARAGAPAAYPAPGDAEKRDAGRRDIPLGN